MRLIIYTYIIFFSFCAFAQTPDLSGLNDLEDILNQANFGPGTSIKKNEEGYKSPIQNEYQNIAKQLTDFDTKLEEELFYSKLQEEKQRLAIQLCRKDPRACFLIDEYRQYKRKADLDDELKLFGTDLFTGYPLSNSYLQSLPTQEDYVIKTGDRLGLLITGSISFNDLIQVDPDGMLTIPETGRVSVYGLTLKDAKNIVRDFVISKNIGAEASIYLEQARANSIFALGNVSFPGSYILPSQASIINLIISAGGIKDKTSLRTIKLIRNNDDETKIDLYNFLIKGEGSILREALKSGDRVIFNGAEDLVSISGEINRPGIYEIIEGDSLEDLLEFALGFTPDADSSRIIIKREGRADNKILTAYDLSAGIILEKGDEIVVQKSNKDFKNFVEVFGPVKDPGLYEVNNDIFLSKILDFDNSFLPNIYSPFALIKRYQADYKAWSYIPFNILNKANYNDIKLQERDKIYFFSNAEIAFIRSNKIYQEFFLTDQGSKLTPEQSQFPYVEAYSEINTVKKNANDSLERSFQNIHNSESKSCTGMISNEPDSLFFKKVKLLLAIFKPNNDLECPKVFQNNPDLLKPIFSYLVPVEGNVNFPSIYPVSGLVQPSALIGVAGGLQIGNIQENNVFLSTKDIQKTVSALEVDDNWENIEYLKVSLFSDQTRYVTLVGAFKYPGIYKIDDKTQILDIYRLAGGLLPNAYKHGAILTRESIKIREKIALSKAEIELANLLASAAMSGIATQSSQDILGIYELITSIGQVEPSGRLVAEMDPNVISRDPSKNILLQAGDTIYMPEIPSSVSVVGNVLNPISLPYEPGKPIGYYIKQAGGFNSNADASQAYIMLPNGASYRPSSSFLSNFSLNNDDKIIPGSTIIVPREARSLSGLALVEVLTPILANLSITAASINAISND